MRITLRLVLLLVAVTVSLLQSSGVHAEVRLYDIDPNGHYTYTPSPEGPGVTGCNPSDFDCGFGIDGTFSVDYDPNADTASFFDVELVLTGNESVVGPPPLATAEGVEQWLEDRLFILQEFSLFPGDLYQDQTFSGLGFTDLLNGKVLLTGGFDFTFVDGIGVHFDLTATEIPEPTTMTLAGTALILILRSGRREVFE